MKKVIVSILAAIYLCSSAGATVHLHYCMGELINWTLNNKSSNKCDKCGMEKDGGCCKDEPHFVKNDLDQKTTESAIQLAQPITSVPSALFVDLFEFYSPSSIEKYPISHAPPLISGDDILIRNCVFRI